jgi:hypothetical protein
MQLANMSSIHNSGDGNEASEWLRTFQTVEGSMEEAANDLNDAVAKGIGNRQKRQIGKKGQYT